MSAYSNFELAKQLGFSGGNMTITSGNFNYSSSSAGTRMSMSFGRVLNNKDRETIKELFQSNVCNQDRESAGDGLTCFREAENAVKKFTPGYVSPIKLDIEAVSEEPDDRPVKASQNQLLKSAEQLNNIILNRVFTVVKSQRELVIRDGQFERDIDHAEFLLIKTFQKLVEEYLEKGELGNAYQAALNIQFTRQGAQAFLNLAKAHLLVDGVSYNALACLNKIYHSEVNESNLRDFINDIEDNLGASTLNSLIRRVKNEKVATLFISQLSGTCLENGDWPKAVSLINTISDDYKRKKELKEVIDFYINNEDFSTALQVIPYLRDDYDEKTKLKGIIDIYIGKDEVSKALPLVHKISSSYDRDQIYIKLIDYYLARNDQQNAKNMLRLINDSYKQNQQKAKFFTW